MSYEGNMLTSVRDEASRHAYAGATDFDGVAGQEYPLTYNGAGSLVSDAGRKIARIDYDLNNNPVRIQFTNGNVTKYVYSATGEKLRVIHQTAVPNITVAIGTVRELTRSEIQYADSTEYLLGGQLTLKNGRIDKYLFEEGYCQAAKYNDTQDKFTFYYYDQDHLGSVRQVLRADRSKNGTVMQTINYYPFGAQFCDGSANNSNAQPYKYNGKELDLMHGLNTYDYGARQYNPVTARWDRVDRMAEKYYPYSPYAYCGNNPVRYIDEHGDSLSLSGSEEDVNSTLNVYNQGMGGYYQASINKNGIVTLCANKNVDFANMTEQETAVYTQLKRVIDSQHMTTINIENNSSEVIIGNAKSATIDIGDINALKGLTQSGPVAALMHETNEQSFLQNPNFRSNDEYRVVRAHAAAEGLEHSYTGNIGVTNILDINSH